MGFLYLDLPPTDERSWFRWSDFYQVSINLQSVFKLWEIMPDFAKRHQIWSNFNISQRRSSWISTISHLISSNSSQISINRIANIDEPLLSMVNDDFPICRRSSQLKIGFSTSNLKMVGLPTDPPFSSFGGGDPSLTVTGVKSAGSWVWSDGLGRWASSQFCLDTPTLVAKTSLVVSSNWC